MLYAIGSALILVVGIFCYNVGVRITTKKWMQRLEAEHTTWKETYDKVYDTAYEQADLDYRKGWEDRYLYDQVQTVKKIYTLDPSASGLSAEEMMALEKHAHSLLEQNNE